MPGFIDAYGLVGNVYIGRKFYHSGHRYHISFKPLYAATIARKLVVKTR